MKIIKANELMNQQVQPADAALTNRVKNLLRRFSPEIRKQFMNEKTRNAIVATLQAINTMSYQQQQMLFKIIEQEGNQMNQLGNSEGNMEK